MTPDPVRPQAADTPHRSAPAAEQQEVFVRPPQPSLSERLSESVSYRHLAVLAACLIVLAGAWLGMAKAQAKIRAEEQLLYSGVEIRDAIAAYYFAAPPGRRELPREWSDLLDDQRDGTHRRHLSRLAPDPVTGARDWVLVYTPDHRIAGVHSASEETPVGRHNFDLDAVQVAGTNHYSQWVFRFDPGRFAPADNATAAAQSPAEGSDAGAPHLSMATTLSVPAETPAADKAPKPAAAGQASAPAPAAAASDDRPAAPTLRSDVLHATVEPTIDPKLARSPSLSAVPGDASRGVPSIAIGAGDRNAARVAGGASASSPRSASARSDSPHVVRVPRATGAVPTVPQLAAPAPALTQRATAAAPILPPHSGATRRQPPAARDGDRRSLALAPARTLAGGRAESAAAPAARQDEAPLVLKATVPDWLKPAEVAPFDHPQAAAASGAPPAPAAGPGTAPAPADTATATASAAEAAGATAAASAPAGATAGAPASETAATPAGATVGTNAGATARTADTVSAAEATPATATPATAAAAAAPPQPVASSTRSAAVSDRVAEAATSAAAPEPVVETPAPVAASNRPGEPLAPADPSKRPAPSTPSAGLPERVAETSAPAPGGGQAPTRPDPAAPAASDTAALPERRPTLAVGEAKPPAADSAPGRGSALPGVPAARDAPAAAGPPAGALPAGPPTVALTDPAASAGADPTRTSADPGAQPVALEWCRTLDLSWRDACDALERGGNAAGAGECRERARRRVLSCKSPLPATREASSGPGAPTLKLDSKLATVPGAPATAAAPEAGGSDTIVLTNFDLPSPPPATPAAAAAALLAAPPADAAGGRNDRRYTRARRSGVAVDAPTVPLDYGGQTEPPADAAGLGDASPDAPADVAVALPAGTLPTQQNVIPVPNGGVPPPGSSGGTRSAADTAPGATSGAAAGVMPPPSSLEYSSTFRGAVDSAPAPGTAPGAAAPPAVTAAAAAAADRTAICDALAAGDRAACAGELRTNGVDAASACVQRIAVRQDQCQSGQALSGLLDR